MILINLLPHREAARKRRRDVFNVSIGASAMLVGQAIGAVALGHSRDFSAIGGCGLPDCAVIFPTTAITLAVASALRAPAGFGR